MSVPTRLRPLMHPVTAAAVLLLGGLVAGYAGLAVLLVAVAGGAAGFANSGST